MGWMRLNISTGSGASRQLVGHCTFGQRTCHSNTRGPKSNIQYWDYLDIEGQLIARVYRQDTSKGKDYRPWDASRNCFGTPTLALYRIPQIHKADTVILVEGEKC
jgi:hypothetical protein